MVVCEGTNAIVVENRRAVVLVSIVFTFFHCFISDFFHFLDHAMSLRGRKKKTEKVSESPRRTSRIRTPSTRLTALSDSETPKKNEKNSKKAVDGAQKNLFTSAKSAASNKSSSQQQQSQQLRVTPLTHTTSPAHRRTEAIVFPHASDYFKPKNVSKIISKAREEAENILDASMRPIADTLINMSNFLMTQNVRFRFLDFIILSVD